MEFKDITNSTNAKESTVDIETEWNLKLSYSLLKCLKKDVDIETEWNLKLEGGFRIYRKLE